MDILIASAYLEKKGFTYPDDLSAENYKKLAHPRLKNFARNFSDEVNITILDNKDFTCKDELVDKFLAADQVILSGSPYNINQLPKTLKVELDALESFLENRRDTSVFGICFGFQMLNVLFGGKVEALNKFYKGEQEMKISNSNDIIPVTAYHEQGITSLAENSELLATGPDDIPYLVKYDNNIIGTQSHPEIPLNDRDKEQFAKKFWKNLVTTQSSL